MPVHANDNSSEELRFRINMLDSRANAVFNFLEQNREALEPVFSDYGIEFRDVIQFAKDMRERANDFSINNKYYPEDPPGPDDLAPVEDRIDFLRSLLRAQDTISIKDRMLLFSREELREHEPPYIDFMSEASKTTFDRGLTVIVLSLLFGHGIEDALDMMGIDIGVGIKLLIVFGSLGAMGVGTLGLMYSEHLSQRSAEQFLLKEKKQDIDSLIERLTDMLKEAEQIRTLPASFTARLQPEDETLQRDIDMNSDKVKNSSINRR